MNGTVGYYPPIGNFTPIPNASIYLYYDTNINYAAHDPATDVINAQYCAYSTNSATIPTNCTVATPASTNPTVLTIANEIEYSSSFNSTGLCSHPPNSLLSPINYNCNIYGNDGNATIPQTCPANPAGASQYCLPYFSNGTGICTSQVGLMKIMKTNANGTFSYNTTACVQQTFFPALLA